MSKNTALQCVAVKSPRGASRSTSRVGGAPSPSSSPQSFHLCTATTTAVAPMVLYVKREHYSGIPDPSSQSSHLFVLQSLGGATNGGANTIDITIPVIKVNLPDLKPQP